MAPKAADPLPLDVAFDREKAFLRQVDEMIAAAVQRALEPTLKELRKATSVMAEVARESRTTQSLVREVKQQNDVIEVNYKRLNSYVTVKEMEEGGLERKFDEMKKAVEKYIEIVSPNLPALTPPSNEPA